ncbi:MAG: autotransporter-associated beta strand repeat-containing protein, partial [Kiritimatiellaeota bacterium]|nr:autotransporter-associated beta strand repeat-containing protein [Kiritimatiellota bacterium]
DWPGNFAWSGEMVMDDPIWGRPPGGAYKANATEEECVLDLNGKTAHVSGLLTDGAYDVTVKNGTLYDAVVQNNLIPLYLWVYGTGTLTLESDVEVTNNNGPFMKNGPGLLRVLGALDSDKPFVMNKGTVEVGHADSLGRIPPTRSQNGEIRIQGDVTLRPLADALDVGRNIWFEDTRTLAVDVPEGMTLTLSGEISNDYWHVLVELCKEGDGTLVLAGAQNTYAGTTTLKAGALSIDSLAQLGHPEFSGTHFAGGVLQVTGLACDTIDSVYVDNWGEFDGGFDIVEEGNAFTVGSAVTVKMGGVFAKAGEGTLVMEGGLTIGAETLRVVGGALGNGGIVVEALDLSTATLEVVAGKDVSVVDIATVAGAYDAPANVSLPPGFALKYRGGHLTASRSGGTVLLVR